MRFTRARDLAVAGGVAAVLVTLFLIVGYDSVPPLPVLAGATLLVLAALELVFTLTLRPRLAGKPGTKPVPPLQAVRAVALAKASSLLGSIMVGGWLGVLIFVFPRRSSIVAAANDTTSGVVGLVSAVALIAVALWLEYCCRTPDDDRNSRDDRSTLPRSS
ncbi:MAG TPA: DUF3180 domain-containing protein [Pseudonocardiaceae bacterium]|nr:DUF3180 domain-containing protein [Pseudonocardiaceae bacterium]